MESLDFLKLYKTKNFSKIRLGNKFDGGYVILNDLVNYDLFISCGISNNIDFEKDFLDKYKNVTCLAFDGTISNIPNNNYNIQFIKKNIGNVDNDTTTTLTEYLKNHENIFLKMDIETWEFRWLEKIKEQNMKKFAQIVIEIHFPFTLSEGIFNSRCGLIEVKEKINLIKKLFKNHKMFHIHGNSACGVTKYENKKLPNVIQCTFVRNDLVSDYQLDNRTIPDPALDNINIKNTTEISFSLNYKKKNIIYAWTINPGPRNSPQFRHVGWGIGDIIRGMMTTLTTYESSKHEVNIDIFNHPIAKYLHLQDYKYKNYTKENIKNIFWCGDNIEEYVNNWNSDNPILLMTNKPLNKKLNKNVKTKILNLFIKNKELQKEIDDIKKKLNLKDNYSIIHFRLGDDQLIRNYNNYNNFDKYYEKYLLHKKDNQLVMSDNILFRKYLLEKEKDIKIFNTENIYHLGIYNDNLKDTLIEFFLVLESKSIKTHSVNVWTSGFVLYPSILKDIPLQNI